MIIVVIHADKTATNARPDGRAREPQLRPAIRSLVVLILPTKGEFFIVFIMADQSIRPCLCSDCRSFMDEPKRGSRARPSLAMPGLSLSLRERAGVRGNGSTEEPGLSHNPQEE